MSVADTTLPHHTPPFCSRRTTPTRPHPRRGGWGLVDLRPVESVGPDEPVQQRARVGVRSLVDDGDQCDYEVRLRDIGVPGEVGDAGPNAGVTPRVLVGGILVTLDVAEHEGCHGLGLEDG